MKANRLWMIVAASGIVLSVVLRIAMIDMPLERDEGMYAYIAQRIQMGELPYTDALETKPPGVFYLYALVLAVSESVVWLRIFLILWQIATVLIFWQWIRQKYGDAVAGIGTAVLSIALTAPVYYGYSGNAEFFMITFVIAALGLLFSDKLNAKTDLAAGALFAAAVLFKPVALTEGLPVLVLIAATADDWRRKIHRLAIVGAGFVAVFGLTFAYFAVKGVAGSFLYWAFIYNTEYASALTLSERSATFLHQITARGMIYREWPVYLIAVIGLFALRYQDDRRNRFLPAAWILSAFVGTAASGRFTPHYFVQLLPPVALLCGIGLQWCITKIEPIRNKPIRLAAAVVLIGFVLVYPPAYETDRYRQGTRLSRTLYGFNPFFEGAAVGDYIAQKTKPEDTVFILGTEAQFLFHAHRKSATRFIAAYPMGGTHPRALEWQHEAFASFEKNRPAVVLIVNLPSSMMLSKSAPKWLENKLRKSLATGYHHTAVLAPVSASDTAIVPASKIPKDYQGIIEFYLRN